MNNHNSTQGTPRIGSGALLGGMGILMLCVALYALSDIHPTLALVMGCIAVPPGVFALLMQILTCLRKKTGNRSHKRYGIEDKRKTL